MSVVSEEEVRREEIKRKLKSKPVLPQTITYEPKEVTTPRIKSTLKIGTDIATVIAKEHRLSKQEMLLRPTVKTVKLIPRELRVKTTIESMRPDITFQKVKEVKIELKPKILKLEVKQPEALRLDKINVRQISEEKLKTSLKPLKVAPEYAKVTTPSKITIKKSASLPIISLRKIIMNIASPKEEEGHPEPKIRKSPSLTKEHVYVPPLLRGLSSVTGSVMDRPICIIVPKIEDDSIIYSITGICREIYRIVKGGRPEPRWISEGLRDEIEKYLKAGGMIFVVDDSKCKFLLDLSKVHTATEFLEKVNIDLVLDRLREFFSQDFGFVVFHISERWASKFAELLREKAGIYVKKENIIEVPVPNWSVDVRKALASILWDYVEGEGSTFDEIFGDCEEKFLKELKGVSKEVELIHWIKEDKSAGEEHENMKVIVVECLAKELGAKNKDDIVRMLKEGIIETECELGSGRADICLRHVRRFVEIETFYGTGNPIKKLDKETLSKYKGMKDVRVDVILLTSVQALLYAEELVKLTEIYSKEYGLEINFYIPNVRERKLIPLEQVFNKLRETFSSSKSMMGLTEDNVKQLWNEFSKALREYGINPEEEKYKRIFKYALNYSKSYQDNLKYIMEEVKRLRNA
jgi:hypothetical protein